MTERQICLTYTHMTASFSRNDNCYYSIRILTSVTRRKHHKSNTKYLNLFFQCKIGFWTPPSFAAPFSCQNLAHDLPGSEYSALCVCHNELMLLQTCITSHHLTAANAEETIACTILTIPINTEREQGKLTRNSKGVLKSKSRCISMTILLQLNHQKRPMN